MIRQEPLLFERSRPGAGTDRVPPAPADAPPVADLLPGVPLRETPPGLPEVGELDLVRHYVRLSQQNFSIDTHFYPLGSCTMKYNPKINEVAAALPGFAEVHPYQPEGTVQGTLAVAYALERYLAAITGLDAVTLHPAAGAHGELTGIMLIQAYHRSNGENRSKILIPDSSHGTNPASCTLCGFETVQVRTAADGCIDFADFESKLSSDVAALMLTNPSTLGLFERQVEKVAARLHDIGAQFYMDGANLNALLGRARPGDFGVDVMHINLHKTFSTPHGGGGPGAGPVAVREHLERFLPVPRVARDGDRYRLLDLDGRPNSIGRVRAFLGSFGMIVRAYTYIRRHGPEGLRRVSGHAVLNANYLMSRVKEAYDLAYPGRPMHEFVLSAVRQKRQGVRALDIAKRLLDLGFHAPTVYFPLIVPEAMMIEPTETESRATLDAFAEALLAIAREAKEDPDRAREAPVTLPVRRFDEVAAARKPILRWRPEGKTGTAST